MRLVIFIRTSSRNPRRFQNPNQICWGTLGEPSPDSSYGKYVWKLLIEVSIQGEYLFKGDAIPENWEYGACDPTLLKGSIAFLSKTIVTKTLCD
jgi:hypothetical protein